MKLLLFHRTQMLFRRFFQKHTIELLSMPMMIWQALQTQSTTPRTEIARDTIFFRRIDSLVRLIHFQFCRYFSLFFSVASTFVYDLSV